MDAKISFVAIALFYTFFTSSFSLIGQTPIRQNALKSNDYGVVYSLPITQLDFEFQITKTTYTRGDYYQYAKQYLNIDNPIIDDKIVYSLDKVEVENRGIPNKHESYLIKFKSNSVEPFVYLTKEGLICAINDTPDISETLKTMQPPVEIAPSVNAQTLLTEEILLAGSKAKQAELIAKQVFDVWGMIF